VYIGKAARRVPITAFALAVNIGIDLALLPVIGISAAAIGTSVAYCIYVPANLRVCRQELRFPLLPLVLVVVRSLLAAGAMALALYAIGGTRTLVLTREVSLAEGQALLSSIAGAAGRRRR
jgi:peptidoglycan biosynthesis protein MviN/MurJ (putative lipid II flippase)